MSEGAASASAFRGGEHIGRYRVLGRVGSGGMSVVYKALDLELERTVALKFLQQQVSTETEKEQLLAEARAASRLDHVNVGVVHGLEQTEEGQWFMVIAYYEGVTLERKIGALLTAQALDIALQTARGLAHAHAHHVLHRDIKPSNVILTPSGTVKIVDFGIARLVPTASETLSAGAKGTAPYMSPEQILGKGADQRSDIWALGVVLAQMLTGRYPFRGDNIGAKVYAIVNEAPLPLDGVPATIQAIVYKALAKDPANRYQTCREMLADIEQAQALLGPAADTVDEISPGALDRNLAKYVKGASKPATKPVQDHWASNRWIRIAVALLAIAVGVVVLPKLVEVIKNSGAFRGEKHIAVLPFDVIGNDPQLVALADGLMDSFTSKLSNLDTGQQSFWVIPASVIRRQNLEDPRKALRDAGATLVVKGSIQRTGSTVHLIVNLISTREMRQLASADLEDASGDFAFLQEQALERLLRVLNVGTGAGVVLAGEITSVPGVYEAYLKALGYMQRYDKPGNLDLAIQQLSLATQRDAGFALGFAELGEAYRLKYKVEKDPQWSEKALTTCKKALAINDKIPTAWVTWGRIQTDTGKYEQAVNEFQKALDLNPRNADAVGGLGHAYEQGGKLAEAEATFKKAAGMRPDYWDGYNTLALFYYRQHRYKEAIAPLKKALELTPDNSTLYSNIAAVYLGTNDPRDMAEAERALKRSIDLAPTYGAYANLGFLYMQQKRWADVAAVSEKAALMNANDDQVWENLGLAYEWLGQSDKAAAARTREFVLVEQESIDKPADGELHATLAALYARRHDVGATLSQIHKALALEPKSREVLFDVGEAYEILGKRSDAITYLRRSLANGYTLADLQRAASLRGLLSDPNFSRK